MIYRTHPIPGRDYSLSFAAQLPSLLATGPRTSRDLAAAAQREVPAVVVVLRRLLRQQRVHVVGWQPQPKGPRLPLFAFGPGENVPRPAPVSHAKKSKRWRRTPEGAMCTAAYKKALHARRKFAAGGVAAIDPLLASLLSPLPQGN